MCPQWVDAQRSLAVLNTKDKIKILKNMAEFSGKRDGSILIDGGDFELIGRYLTAT